MIFVCFATVFYIIFIENYGFNGTEGNGKNLLLSARTFLASFNISIGHVPGIPSYKFWNELIK